MRIEEREVTVTKSVYIADDGKEFDTEIDCERYEMRKIEENIDFYDDELKPTNLDRSMYAVLDTKEKVKGMVILCEYMGYATKGLHMSGVYHFADGEWLNISNIVKALSGGF
jgi:hypothetical protein